MTEFRHAAIIAAIASAALLAGCQTANRTSVTPTTAPTPTLTPAPPPAPTVAAVSGRWKPYNNGAPGYGYSEFKSGTYAAYPPDGKSTLAIGTYTATPTGAVIKYFSAARKQDVTVNCRLANPNLLDCQTQDGTKVELRKA